MNNWKLVRLNFGRHHVHFGEVGIGIEETSDRVRSDTLFSAWINAYARLFGGTKVEELLQKFKSSSPVRMSSTFVYRRIEKNGNDNKNQDDIIYYLPRPLNFPLHYPEKEDLSFFKAYKKLNYLPLKIWKRWYQNEGFTESDRMELETQTRKYETKGDLQNAGAFSYGDAFKRDILPKIAVDRVTRATNFYHTGYVQYNWKQEGNDIINLAGLYFLLYFPETDKKLEHRLYAALELLGELGLGGERSSGAGRFTVDSWDDISSSKEWKEIISFSGSHYCLISLFWQESIDHNCLKSYELLERGGWISSPVSGQQLRRKKVRMFAEGSVFSSQPLGKLADVTPSEFKAHSIYRNGISLSLPINIHQ